MKRLPPVIKLVVIPALLAVAAAVEVVSIASGEPQASIRRVAVIADSEQEGPARHGLRKLEESLRAKGITVTEASQPGSADFVILAGLSGGRGPAATALGEANTPAPSGAEALTIRTGVS